MWIEENLLLTLDHIVSFIYDTTYYYTRPKSFAIQDDALYMPSKSARLSARLNSCTAAGERWLSFHPLICFPAPFDTLPLKSVEAKSLKKAFEKERMTRQNAEYLVRRLVNGWMYWFFPGACSWSDARNNSDYFCNLAPYNTLQSPGVECISWPLGWFRFRRGFSLGRGTTRLWLQPRSPWGFLWWFQRGFQPATSGNQNMFCFHTKAHGSQMDLMFRDVRRVSDRKGCGVHQSESGATSSGLARCCEDYWQ